MNVKVVYRRQAEAYANNSFEKFDSELQQRNGDKQGKAKPYTWWMGQTHGRAFTFSPPNMLYYFQPFIHGFLLTS